MNDQQGARSLCNPSSSMDGSYNSCNRSSIAQKRKRKVHHACVFCQRSHMTCDESRPCQRCIKRRIGHLCHDSTAQDGIDCDPLNEGNRTPTGCVIDPNSYSMVPKDSVETGEDWDLPEAYLEPEPTIEFLYCDELCKKLGAICEELYYALPPFFPLITEST